MYFPSQGLLVLEVPKCGSRTLVKACKKKFGHNEFAGHISIVETERRIEQKKKFNHTLDWDIKQVVRIVRDPLDRVVSALNYACKDRFSLDYLIDRMLEGNPKALNSTQVIWVDSPNYTSYNSKGDIIEQKGNPNDPKAYPVETFRLDQMKEALEWLGCEKVNYWENKSKPIFNKRDVVTHCKYKEIQERYKEDFELWKQFKND